MIVSPDWIWLHVPKCAGSSTEKILHNVFGQEPSVIFDEVGPKRKAIWHQSISARQRDNPDFSVNGRRVIGNIRRLPSWLLSRVHFEIQRHGEKATPTRQQLLHAKFVAIRRDDVGRRVIGTANAALEAYSADVTDWIRTEVLAKDISRVFNISEGHPALAARPTNTTRADYVKALSFWFTPKELQQLYTAAPLWADVERKVYGDILHL